VIQKWGRGEEERRGDKGCGGESKSLVTYPHFRSVFAG